MTTSSKYESTNKWLVEAGGTTSAPTGNGDAEEPLHRATEVDDAVIIIESEPVDVDAFSWKKFMLHMGYVKEEKAKFSGQR